MGKLTVFIAGILSTATPQQLFAMSKKSGLQMLNYFEWSGEVNQNIAAAQNGTKVGTACGGLLLNFGEFIALENDYTSAGQYGQFQLNLTVSCRNTTSQTITPELVIVCYNSSLFTSSQGSSASYTFLLNRQDVVDAKLQEPISSFSVQRVLGAGMMDRIRSLGSFIHRNLPRVKELLATSSHPVAQRGKAVLESLGYGKKMDKRLM